MVDRIFASAGYPHRFAFDQQVAAVFDDMAHRSIPLYQTVLDEIARIAQRTYQPSNRVYDLGCATGAGLLAASRFLPGGSLVGIDNSPAMIAAAEQKLTHLRPRFNLQLLCEDACKVAFADASLVISHYTLQFIPPAQRHSLLQKLAQSLCPSGFLVISDKVIADDGHLQANIDASYCQFKRDQGYSDLEIQRKKEALTNFLIPLKLDEQIALLRTAGFASIEVLYKYLNFVTLVAKAPPGFS